MVNRPVQQDQEYKSLSLYQKAVDRFSSAVENKNFDGVISAGMLPFIGFIPSGVAAVYSAARTVDRLAAVCFYSARQVVQRDQHNYTVVEKAQQDLGDYFSLCVGTTLGMVTGGLAYLSIIDITDLVTLF